MTTYKDIRGTHIKTVTTDPPAPQNGQMWYNSTTKVVKGFTNNPVGSWSSGGNLNTGRYWGSSAGADSTAALVFGGYNNTVHPVCITRNESYNGTTWTEVGDLTTRKMIACGAGTYTSALSFLGNSAPGGYSAANESWNGSSWTEVGDLAVARRQAGGAGASNTSAIGFGGETPPQGDSALTEVWNGTAWTEVADLNTSRGGIDGGPMGTATAALAAGGYKYNSPSGAKLLTENWNGSSWTEVGDPDTGGDGRFGNPSAALLSNGTDIILWNGTSWSETTARSTNVTAATGAGTTSSGLLAGGEPPSASGSTATEEWVAPTTSTVTFTAS